MCGIAGFFSSQETLRPAQAAEVLARMCGVIAHRGPDGEGFYQHQGAALGMRRLAIIDLLTGQQPMSSEDGKIHLVFNGEIYNYRELRTELAARGHQCRTSSDTETILRLYQESGERVVEKLRGMFAFAIMDEREGKLLLARDRVGKKPLHYALVNDTLIFGSEIKSLLQHPFIEREVNPAAIADFLTFGYIPDPATAFRGIYKLPAGHTLRFQDNRLSLHQYWDFNYDRQSNVSEQRRPPCEAELILQLRELLSEAVRLRLVSDVPLGAFLSGGLDSSTVVALMQQQMQQPVKTFSIGFREADFDELHFTRVAARYFHTDHHEFIVTPDVEALLPEIVWHHDEPFADVSSIPTYLLSRMAREHVTVALSGDGGDELFAGYDRYVTDQHLARYERLPQALRRGLLQPLSRLLPARMWGRNRLHNLAQDAAARYITNLSFFDVHAQRELLTTTAQRALDGYDPANLFHAFYELPETNERLERLLYLDSKTYLPGDVLTKVDRMSMANSLETRAPLLDHPLIEFVQMIPAALKLQGTQSKFILKKAVTGMIPPEIIHRPKQGFDVPIRHWLNHELRDLVSDLLADQRTRERGYFEQRAVQAVLCEHRSSRRNKARHLWELLMLELWHRTFIDAVPEMNFAGAKSLSPELRQITSAPAA